MNSKLGAYMCVYLPAPLSALPVFYREAPPVYKAVSNRLTRPSRGIKNRDSTEPLRGHCPHKTSFQSSIKLTYSALPGSYQRQGRPEPNHWSQVCCVNINMLHLLMCDVWFFPYLYVLKWFCTHVLMQLVICSSCHTAYTIFKVNTFQLHSLGSVI